MSITLPKIIGYSYRIPSVSPVERSPALHGDHRGSRGFNPFLKKGKPYAAGARDRKAGAFSQGIDPHRRPYSCPQSREGLAPEVKHGVKTGLSRGALSATPTPYIPLTGGRGDMAPLTLEVLFESGDSETPGSRIDIWL